MFAPGSLLSALELFGAPLQSLPPLCTGLVPPLGGRLLGLGLLWLTKLWFTMVPQTGEFVPAAPFLAVAVAADVADSGWLVEAQALKMLRSVHNVGVMGQAVLAVRVGAALAGHEHSARRLSLAIAAHTRVVRALEALHAVHVLGSEAEAAGMVRRWADVAHEKFPTVPAVLAINGVLVVVALVLLKLARIGPCLQLFLVLQMRCRAVASTQRQVRPSIRRVLGQTLTIHALLAARSHLDAAARDHVSIDYDAGALPLALAVPLLSEVTHGGVFVLPVVLAVEDVTRNGLLVKPFLCKLRCGHFGILQAGRDRRGRCRILQAQLGLRFGSLGVQNKPVMTRG